MREVIEMNKIRKIGVSLCLMICLGFSMAFVSSAEGTTMITLSQTSIVEGDTVSVTITGSQSSKITVKYNTGILLLKDCDVAGYSKSGNSVVFSGKNGTVTFSGLSEGTSNIIVTSDKCAGSSTSISVKSTNATENVPATDNMTEDDVQTVEEAPVNASTGNVYQASNDGKSDYMINGEGYVVSERFTDAEIPAGFSKTSVKIHNKTLNEVTNGSQTLVYLKPASNTAGSGVFYLYDEAADTVSDLFILGGYILSAGDPSSLSPMLVAASCDVDGRSVPCYQISGSSNGFYYFYGSSGDYTGWVEYCSADGSAQRLNEEIFSLVAEPEVEEPEVVEPVEPEKEKKSFDFSKISGLLDNTKLIAIVIFVLVVILVIVINIMVFRKNNEDEDIFDEDGDGYDDFEEDNAADEEDEDDEDEDDEDEDDEDEEDEEEPRRRGLFGRRKESDDPFDEEDDEDDEEEELKPVKPSRFAKKTIVEDDEEETDEETTSEAAPSNSLKEKKLEVLDFNDL